MVRRDLSLVAVDDRGDETVVCAEIGGHAGGTVGGQTSWDNAGARAVESRSTGDHVHDVGHALRASVVDGVIQVGPVVDPGGGLDVGPCDVVVP